MATVILLGLGLDELSMSAFGIPEIKRIIRSTTILEAEEFLGTLMDMKSIRDIDRYVRHWMEERFEFITDREDRLPRVVIAGRPNVGKSTMFNRLIRKRKAITDPTPGVTRDTITERSFIKDQEVLLMDTGGFKLERTISSMNWWRRSPLR